MAESGPRRHSGVDCTPNPALQERGVLLENDAQIRVEWGPRWDHPLPAKIVPEEREGPRKEISVNTPPTDQVRGGERWGIGWLEAHCFVGGGVNDTTTPCGVVVVSDVRLSKVCREEPKTTAANVKNGAAILLSKLYAPRFYHYFISPCQRGLESIRNRAVVSSILTCGSW